MCPVLSLKLDKSVNKQKQIMKTLDDLEEKLAKANAAKRKVQREFEELTEERDTLSKELSVARGKRP